MSEDSPERLDGRPLSDAVDDVVARDSEREEQRVRETLAVITDEDDAVSAEAVEGALGEVSKVVSTPETRAELAGSELLETRMDVRPYEDIDAVASRLDGFEARMTAVESTVESLQDDLAALVDDHPPTYETAAELRRLTETANEAQAAADELMEDVEAFARWFDDPEVRYAELEGDVEGLENSLLRLSDNVEQLETGVEQYGDDAGHAVGGYDAPPDAVWADLALRHRVTAPLLADLRAEVDDLEELDERTGVEQGPYGGRPAEVRSRLDDVEELHGAVGERVDDLGDDGWRERHGESLASLDATLADVEPPVDWATVQAALDQRRDDIEGLA
jgi:chromosome segregation ATPase